MVWGSGRGTLGGEGPWQREGHLRCASGGGLSVAGRNSKGSWAEGARAVRRMGTGVCEPPSPISSFTNLCQQLENRPLGADPPLWG